MAIGQETKNRPMVPQASLALDKFKYEVANEIGIDQSPIQNGYWGFMTSRDCGAVGGNMVRRMIQAAEQALIQQAAAGVQAGFSQALNPNQPAFAQSSLQPNWQQANPTP